MNAGYPATVYKVGAVSAALIVALNAAYLVVLAIGLLTLPSPEDPIQDPWFTAMEVLILVMGPALVALAAAVYHWVPEGKKVIALLGLVFMAGTTVLSSAVHFCILSLGDAVKLERPEAHRLLFAFEWPSLVYALDVLAWDFFFSIAVVAIAMALPGDGAVRLARGLLLLSGGLALVGLAGVPLANMQVRNIGIVGYVIVFPVAVVFLFKLFRREASRGCRSE